MAGHMRRPATAESVDALLEKSLSRFLTRQELRFGMLTSNLRMGSSHFRYALRVSIAALLGMSAPALLELCLSDKDMTQTLMAQRYLIILNIHLVIQPGLALPRTSTGSQPGT